MAQYMGSRTPKRGRGSNQYVTKPPGAAADDGRMSHAAQAHSVEATDDPDEIAWAFYPDSQTWKARGFPTEQDAKPWIKEGFDPVHASYWRGLVDHDPAVIGRFYRAGVSEEETNWLLEEFEPDEAFAWAQRRYRVDYALAARKAGYTPDTAPAMNADTMEELEPFYVDPASRPDS